jgi:hypothetical protein
MSAPLFGITYSIAGATCFIVGIRKLRIMPLGGIMIVVAALNIYVEIWPIPKYSFESAASLLLIGFLWPYTALSMGLMEDLGIAGRHRRFVSSFLPLVYVLALGFVMLLPRLKTLENPPLALYIFIVFLSVIHIPGFVAGKSQVMGGKTYGRASRAYASNNYTSLLRIPLLSLSPPLLIIFLVQVTTRDDWRLFCSNAVLTVAITLLFALARWPDPKPCPG